MLERCWRDVGEGMERCLRGAGEMLERCWRDVGEMSERCWRDVGEVLERCWRGAGETNSQLTPWGFFLGFFPVSNAVAAKLCCFPDCIL